MHLEAVGDESDKKKASAVSEETERAAVGGESDREWRSKAALFSLSSKPTLLPLLLSMLVKGMTPLCPNLRTLSAPVAGEDTHLGFIFFKCSHRLRAYLSELQPRTPAAGIRNGGRQLIGAYIVSIHGRSVFTVEQANLALTAAFDATAAGDPIEFAFAPESRSDAVDFRRPPLHLQLSQLKRIHAFRTVSGDGDSASVSATVAALEDAYTDADLFETSDSWRRSRWCWPFALMN